MLSQAISYFDHNDILIAIIDLVEISEIGSSTSSNWSI